jgi:hypothetical protein
VVINVLHRILVRIQYFPPKIGKLVKWLDNKLIICENNTHLNFPKQKYNDKWLDITVTSIAYGARMWRFESFSPYKNITLGGWRNW